MTNQKERPRKYGNTKICVDIQKSKGKQQV